MINTTKKTSSKKAEAVSALEDCLHRVQCLLHMVVAADHSNFTSVLGIKCTFSLALSIVTSLFAVISFFFSTAM